jgi:hypothetical protein
VLYCSRASRSEVEHTFRRDHVPNDLIPFRFGLQV